MSQHDRKLKSYMQISQLVSRGMPIRNALEKVGGLSATTYYKYQNLYGDEISPGKFEVTPVVESTEVAPVVKERRSAPDSKDQTIRELTEKLAKLSELVIRNELAKLQ